ARTLHQGNREGAGRHDIPHRAAGNCAEESAGDDADLCGSAAAAAGYGIGEADEEFSYPGRFHERAAGDGQDEIAGCRIHGEAVEALGAEDRAEDAIDSVTAVTPDARNGPAEEGVEDEYRAERRKYQTEHPARHFQDEKKRRGAGDHVAEGRVE